MDNNIQLKKLPAVKLSMAQSRTTIYRNIQSGYFPKGVPIGGDRVAWPDYEIEAINRAKISGFGSSAIKILVSKLHELREGLKPGLDVAAEVARIFDELNGSQKNKTV
ncbi:MAG: AlpA family phage regulatory protein [Methyloglobulus sp.]|nr:AlpA family phage regulatory protein [Methyloglobulus sp.]